MSHPDAVAVVESVSVSYGSADVLQDVSAEFSAGATGLLGPNGAGKSTLIKTLLGLVTPRRGRVRILGHDVAEAPRSVRARLGYLPESDGHIPGMNAVAFVAYCGELAGLPGPDAIRRAHETLYYVGLGEARYRALETFSTGMKQRIKLAQALVHDPDLLLLDEPTNGMDPGGREDMLALARDLAVNKGISVVLSSHLLPDVETVCDRVVVLDKGRVALQGPIADLKEPRGRVFELRVKAADASAAESFAEALAVNGFTSQSADGDLLRVFVPEADGPRRLFALASASRVQVRHLRPSVATLDEVFEKAVTGR